MPNWCYNNAKFTHEDSSKVDELEKVLKQIDDKVEGVGLFQHLVPNPSGDWCYEWSVENWGTKWDVYPLQWDRIENTITLVFDSAWSPPTVAYESMCDDGWEVDALYHEPGMGFAGQFIDGEDNCVEYDFTDPEWDSDLSEDLKELLEPEYEWFRENEADGN